MSMLGKILAIFNVLAAIAFVYFASADWAKRHSWTYAAYRHDLAIEGLPLDAEERHLQDGDVLVEHLSDGALQEMFNKVGGNGVRTQAEEVKKVQAAFKTEIEGLPNEGDKRRRLGQILGPLARTGIVRDELLQRINDPKVSFDDLMKDYDSVFDAALNPPTTKSEEAISLTSQLLPKDRRAAIAHLLFNTNPSDEYHQRLQVVIGLRAITGEANLQASALTAMTDRVRTGMLADRAAFEVEYKGLLDQVRERAEELADRRLFLENQQRIKAEHQKLKDSRERDIKDTNEAIEKAAEATKKLVDEQAKEEQVLFESQRVLRTVVSDNERLEREIRSLEKVQPKAQ